MNVDPSVFSSGQVSSKLWLCTELEKLFDNIPYIWLYGGWYGMTAFLLYARNKITINKIYSYDLDPECRNIADSFNENWVWQNWKFKAFTMDCNYLEPHVYHPDCIINTSTEHFEEKVWFNNIPKDTLVVLQGNNMIIDEHKSCVESLDQFIDSYPLTETLFSGQKDFTYPQWGFSRFMIIGYK